MKRAPRKQRAEARNARPAEHRAAGARTTASLHDEALALQRDIGNTRFAEFLQRQAAPAVPAPASWAFDPSGLLDDVNVNPAFRQAAKAGLSAAVAADLRPVVREAYRAPARSDELYRLYKQGKAGRAAPAWASLHNYGLAMDVYLYDEGGKLIETPRKGWYKAYKQLASYLQPQGLEWGEPINDTDHFEFHPSWSGLAGGKLLASTRKWALRMAAAADEAAQASVADWVAFFWWAAGAGGIAPQSTPEGP